MKGPSLLWFALRDVGRERGNERDEVVAALVEGIAQAPDVNETHTAYHPHGPQSVSLIENALYQWGYVSQAAFAFPLEPAPAYEQVAQALVARGAAVWSLPDDQRARVLGAILDQEMWSVWADVLAQPDRPAWDQLLPMAIQSRAYPGETRSLWQQLRHHPQALVGLLTAGLPANYTSSKGQTLLFTTRDLGAARWLAAQGVDPLAMDDQGKTAAAHHQHNLTVDDRRAWFDLCGREGFSPESAVRMAMTEGKTAYLATIKKPTEVRWERAPGVILTPLDGAIHAAVNSDKGQTQSALFHHLLDTATVWPAQTRTMAALAWVGSAQPEQADRRTRIEKRLGEALDLEALQGALPQWLPYLHQLDPEAQLFPYAAWWEHSPDLGWRIAVLDAQLDKFKDDPNFWHERTSGFIHARSGSELMDLALRARTGAFVPGWSDLPRHHRFALTAWALAGIDGLDPEFSRPSWASTMLEAHLSRCQEEAQVYLSVLHGLIWEGESPGAPQWQDWRGAMEGLRGNPLGQVMAFAREHALAQRPAPVPPRPRYRA